MTTQLFKYTFEASLAMTDVEQAFIMAIFATEAIHGECQTRLSAEHFLDIEKHACVVDASTPVGRSLNKLFTGFLRRGCGEDGFRVERIEGRSTTADRTVTQHAGAN
jgi:hypothetical protein